MNFNKKKLKCIMLVIIILAILFFLWKIFLIGNIFSKYQQQVNANGLTQIAKPIFIVDGTENIEINGIEDTVYNFSVKNYEENQVSEVDLYYYINIVNNSLADLDFELIGNGINVPLNDNKSSRIILSSETKQEDIYQLKIKYKNNLEIVDDISGNVQIKIEALQTER